MLYPENFQNTICNFELFNQKKTSLKYNGFGRLRVNAEHFRKITPVEPIFLNFFFNNFESVSQERNCWNFQARLLELSITCPEYLSKIHTYANTLKIIFSVLNNLRGGAPGWILLKFLGHTPIALLNKALYLKYIFFNRNTKWRIFHFIKILGICLILLNFQSSY